MATKQPKDSAAANKSADLPARIKLLCPYAFYDEDNQMRMWGAGHESIDPDEIALLVGRGVEFETLE